jgi:hypothetical protein
MHPQSNLAASTQLAPQPTQISPPARQVTVKREPEGKLSQYMLLRFEELIKFTEDPPLPPPGLATERFTPYTGYLPRSSLSVTMVKQEPGESLQHHSELGTGHHSQGWAEAVAPAAGWLDLQDIQSARRRTFQGPVQTHFGSGAASWAPGDGVPYSWAYKYTPQYARNLARDIAEKHLPKADRNDFLKTLEAAKANILELMTEEQRIELNLDDVPADYTGLKKIARQLDLIIPLVFIPQGPDILPMDRMIRALQAYIGRLRLNQKRLRKDAARAEHRTAPDPQLASGSEPSNVIDKENKNGNLSKPRKEKVKGKKGKPRSSKDQTSVPKIQTKPKASKKRKHGTNYDTEQALDTKSSKKKKKKQKLSTPIVEQEMPEPEVKEPKAKTKKKEKQAMILCPQTEEDIPDKAPPLKKRKKDTSPPSEDNAPEPATEHRRKKTKKSSGPDEEEPSDDPQPEPSSKKNKNNQAKKESTPVDETSAHNTPEPQSNADASFLSEALETTEEKNHGLTQEISSLKVILQAVGISGVKLSVALTRMRHGQSAEEIFSSIKKEGS